MAVDRAERAQQQRPSALGTLLGLPWRIAMVVLVSLLCSIVIEWVGMYWDWWSLPGSGHAEQTMSTEMGWLDTAFTRSLLFSDPVATASALVEWLHTWLFVKTGIAGWLAANEASGGWVGTLHTYLQAAVYVTLMTLTRCVILALTSPLFVMAALVGFVDGLVRRDLRRFGAGRESAFIYHHAKRAVTPIFIIGWLIYLSVPFSFHPNVFLLPCAVLFGLMISIATGSFKKYL
ncbi:TIGR03747 family integrating conjugative element membrane protein [Halomonas sabkhae]|uniref:TIGR03747 family integrating conjugative element membrane protein n=1 Tax=Halomonas sabkhae TaxID=626223 RepID=UPI0025B51755|nr:TIGR03747 family integrating conjugative element membrane protein [Halomonas sabkhae]MDN3525329.1 TIGR03747 family integrating conjugative element membrane protein [Halomonas sabkhae]